MRKWVEGWTCKDGMQTTTGSFTFFLEIVKWSSDNPKPAFSGEES